MSDRRHMSLSVLLAGAVVLCAMNSAAVGQVIPRDYGSRGINPPGPRSRFWRTPTTFRGTGPAPNLPGSPVNVNPGGPLSFDWSPSLGTFYPGVPTPFYLPADAFSPADADVAGDAAGQSDGASASSRPNIRPRLDIATQGAARSAGALRDARQAIVAQLARAPEIPLTPQWFATRPDFAPVPVDGGNSWQVSDWDQVRQWLGWADEPLRYDYRTDRLGMIFVYCNDAVRERGVDARRPATELAHRESTGEQLPAGISLGVFAAVSPRNEPVTTLLQLALGKSGSVFGYHYDLTENTARPLRGALDESTQRVAWHVEGTVWETGLKNLTQDAARMLVFRQDGWTQTWILMRLGEQLVTAEAEKPPSPR